MTTIRVSDGHADRYLFTLTLDPDNTVHLAANNREVLVLRPRGQNVVKLGFRLIGLGLRVIGSQIARLFD